MIEDDRKTTTVVELRRYFKKLGEVCTELAKFECEWAVTAHKKHQGLLDEAMVASGTEAERREALIHGRRSPSFVLWSVG